MRCHRLLFLVLLLSLSALRATAQSCPVVGTNYREDQWKVGQELNIYLDPGSPFLTQCRDQLQAAMNAWQYGSANTKWGVSFNFTTSTSASNFLGVYYRTPILGTCNSEDAGCFHPQHESDPAGYGQGMVGGTIEIDPHHASCDALGQTFAHELGHGFGLADCHGCGNTIMVGALKNSQGQWITNPNLPLGPTNCDETNVHENTDWQIDTENSDEYCWPVACARGSHWDLLFCMCVEDPPHEGDPIILDLRGNGLDLTSDANGVWFDLTGSGVKRKIGWTAPASDDAWLALDRNGNGTIDHGLELFSDRAEQPPSAEPNGFLALGVLDTPARGGNGDGRIDASDREFAHLLVWQDRNHDGVSQAGELSTLAANSVRSIDLDIRSSGRHDHFGNYLRYRAKLEAPKGVKTDRWAYDVFVRVGQ